MATIPPPDKNTLTAFSKKAQTEIDQHAFAAKTGGLVMLSAPSFWELLYAAQAWHEHLAAMKLAHEATAEYMAQGADLRDLVNDMVRAGAIVDERPNEQQPATAT